MADLRSDTENSLGARRDLRPARILDSPRTQIQRPRLRSQHLEVFSRGASKSNLGLPLPLPIAVQLLDQLLSSNLHFGQAQRRKQNQAESRDAYGPSD